MTNLRVHYAKIILLTFDEKPIKEIQGNITAGSLNVNGSAAIRRTVSLTMLATAASANTENLENDISIKKKIKLFVGYKEANQKEIDWINCGIFLISQANVSRSTNGWTISIQGKDKMSTLDGSLGGVIPFSVTFSDYEYEDYDTGIIEREQVILRKIIQEAVVHWGEERDDNVVISDVEDSAKMLMKYVGDGSIGLKNDYNSIDFNPDPTKTYEKILYTNDDAGYVMTPFVYPGELTMNAGQSVTNVLDKIKEVLGNFEYYYDINGRFIFQEQKNYLNMPSIFRDLKAEDYVKTYSNTKNVAAFLGQKEDITIVRTPKYDNIKNDYVVWGKKKDANGNEYDIHYRLVIDNKPQLDKCLKYMWEVKSKSSTFVVGYKYTDTDRKPSVGEGETCELFCGPAESGGWREEMFRNATKALTDENEYSYYDNEFLAFWRDLFDPNKEEWEGTDGWNPDVFNNPKNLNFWIDFIDEDAAITKYSVKNIGRRMKVLTDDKIRTIFNNEVPDLVFVKNIESEWKYLYVALGCGENPDKETLDEIETAVRQKFSDNNQRYMLLTEAAADLFATSATGQSAFEAIRELLYQYLTYNTTITITCLPKYFLEPNNIVYIEDKQSGIKGNYSVTQYSLPLAYSGTMQITLSEVLTRV